MLAKKKGDSVKLENAIEQDIQQQNPPTVLAEGALFEGDFEAKEPMLIHGTVQGDIKSASDITLSTQAQVVGNVEAANMTVAGKTQGAILISGTTEMIEKGAIKGNLNTNRFIMSEGALFDGKLKIRKPKKIRDAHLETKVAEKKVKEKK